MRFGFAMNQTTVQELQFHLSQYLTNESTLQQFREWFDGATWGLVAEPDSAIRRMAGEIELRLAEFTGGTYMEDSLRDYLAMLLPDTGYQIPVTFAEPFVEMISS